MSGTYCMKRGWMDHEMFSSKEPFSEREAWVWMIETAVWKKKTINISGSPVTIDRGQLSYSIRYMAEKFNWGRSKTSRYIEKLKKWDTIKTETKNGQLLITICNYEEHQLSPNHEKNEEDQKAGQQRDSSGTAAGQIRIPENTGLIPEEETLSVPSQEDMVEVWNEVCGNALNKVIKITEPRKQKLRKRAEEDFQTLECWRTYCERIRGSPFLTGDNDKGWKADFDWVLEPRNLTKIIEGKYDRGNNKPTSSAHQAMFAGFGKADTG